MCNSFAHTKNQPHFSLGTELEQHCMTPNNVFPTNTHVFSVLKRVPTFCGHTDRWGHTTDEPHFPTVHYCACPLTVPSLFLTVQCAVLALVSLVPGVWRLTCGWCRLAVGSIPPAAQLQHNRSPPSHHHPHLHPPSSPSHTGESFIQYLGSYYNFRFQTSRQHHLQQTPLCCNVCIVSDIPSRDGGPGVSTAAL